MKKRSFRIISISIILSIILLHITCVCITTFAYSTGDDYPSKYRDYPQDSIVDEWNFYNRECTSFAAWCLNSRNGVAFHNYYGGVHWGGAINWGNAAKTIGITVDKNPAIGSIAWWSSGHVAWVQEVNGSNVTIEEYNYKKGVYSCRTLSSNSITGFIHIKDISTQSPAKPTVTTVSVDGSNVTVSWNASSGATQYSVDFCAVSGSAYTHNYVDTNSTSFTKSLADGQYAIRVSAKNSAGESGFTNFYYVDVIANPIPISFDANGGELEKTKARIAYDSLNGGRGTNQLVIYTTGSSKTGTNTYGIEVITQGNKVTSIENRIGNATVPVGGFIVSAHGEKHYFLQDNVQIGDYINYHGNPEEVWIWSKNGWLSWTKKAKNGSAYGELPIPIERDGYRFTGWYTDSEQGTQITSDTTVTVNSAQTLYAHWEKIPSTETTITKESNYSLIDVQVKDADIGDRIIISTFKYGNLSDIQIKIYDGSDISVATFKPFDTVKVMVWKSAESLSPIAKPEIVEIN